MNGLVRWAVTTSLATIELVLTKTLDGVRVANVMLASPGPEQRQLAAAPSSAPASSEAGARPGWRSPERGNLDATSAALRARAAARPVPGTLVARAEPVGAAEVTSEAASRTRPPRRRVVVASASAGSLAGRVVPEPEAPRPIASETPAIADPAAIAEGLPTTPSRRSASVRLAPAKRGSAKKVASSRLATPTRATDGANRADSATTTPAKRGVSRKSGATKVSATKTSAAKADTAKRATKKVATTAPAGRAAGVEAPTKKAASRVSTAKTTPAKSTAARGSRRAAKKAGPPAGVEPS